MLNHFEDNEAHVAGICQSLPEYSHSVKDESFYSFKLKVNRLSENSDVLIVTLPEKMLLNVSIKEGKMLKISGQFRSYNNYKESGSKLILTLFAKEMEEVEEKAEFENEIYLNGFLCKKPVFRVTPFGREIADILLAVNRAYNKSDYIPCIAWGKNARIVKNMQVGQNLKISGRIQSREYQKKLSETETVTKTAYEVSASQIEAENEASAV